MLPSSARGQVEPLAAIVAVVAVGIGLSVYAGVLDASLPGPRERGVADATLGRVWAQISTGGVADPARLARGPAVAPGGYRTNVTLAAEGRTWRAGPEVPSRADAAERHASVRLAPGRVRPGRLRVAVWR